MYYTVIDDLGHTCGHKHKTFGNAMDCLDKLIDKKPDQWDIPAVEIIEVNKKVDFECDHEQLNHLMFKINACEHSL